MSSRRKSRGPRKPRGDCQLKMLPDAMQAEIYAYMKEHSGPLTIAWLRDDRGIETDKYKLSDFWHWYPTTLKVKRAVSYAENFDQAVEKSGAAAKLNVQERRDLIQLVFEHAAAEEEDTETFVALRKLEIKRSTADRQNRLAEEQIARLQREKADWESQRAQLAVQADKLRGATAESADNIRTAVVEQIDRIMGLKK